MLDVCKMLSLIKYSGYSAEDILTYLSISPSEENSDLYLSLWFIHSTSGYASYILNQKGKFLSNKSKIDLETNPLQQVVSERLHSKCVGRCVFVSFNRAISITWISGCPIGPNHIFLRPQESQAFIAISFGESFPGSGFWCAYLNCCIPGPRSSHQWLRSLTSSPHITLTSQEEPSFPLTSRSPTLWRPLLLSLLSSLLELSPCLEVTQVITTGWR